MNAVVHMTECKLNSTIASARVARFISDTLSIALIDTQQKASEQNGQLKHLIIVNGPMAFCDFLPELGSLVRKAEKVIWVQQDYTIMPPSDNSKAESPFRKAFADKKLRPIFWTTCDNQIKEPGDRYINWNKLTYNLQPLKLMNNNHVLYYGAFRQKRLSSFERFFKSGSFPLAISTTTLRRKKFEAMGAKATFVPAFENVIVDAGRYDASLYIEDDKSHKEFHSPANRFYEMLSAGVPIFFDTLSVLMLRNAGIIVPEKWQVSDAADLGKKYYATDLVKMREEQRVLWSKDYVQELTDRLKELWKDINGG